MNASGTRLRGWFGRNYMQIGRKIWWRLPAWARHLPPVHWFGLHLHAIVQQTDVRDQNHSTLFFRNRAELELLSRLVKRAAPGARLKLAVLGCSKGAEVYSIVGALRLARPDLHYNVFGVDISQEILEFARQGVYALPDESRAGTGKDGAGTEGVHSNTVRDQRGLSIFDRLSPIEMEAMFEKEGNHVKVKPWLKEGISWHCGNVEDPNLLTSLGPQDVVVANRFLCHMKPVDAERCLRALARLVKPGGYLFASGVDLDVRTKVAKEMGWEPVKEMMREVYEGDQTLRDGWPTEYWAIEPFQSTRRDWIARYSSAFRVGANASFAWATSRDIAWINFLA